MEPPYQRLRRLAAADDRLAIGLMSGTSMDGVDAVLVHVGGQQGLPVQRVAWFHQPIAADLRERMVRAMQPHQSDVTLLCELNIEIGEVFAQAALGVMHEARTAAQDIALIGSHGQTVYHIPRANEARGWQTASTLQLGDPSVIAARTGVTTVGNFRVRDMALGGVGAPLIPFVDGFLFGSSTRDVLCQNLGGIANCTLVRRDGLITAFDSGPANMVMDLLMQKLGGVPYDQDGEQARAGRVIQPALEEALRHPFFQQAPPKATGHEDFGESFADWLIEQTPGASCSDRVATACELTARSIVQSYRDHFFSIAKPESVIVSGGGAKNRFLMERLRDLAPALDWQTIEAHGIDSAEKEALGFAVLGYATLCGIPANAPSVTGANEACLLGNIAPGDGCDWFSHGKDA